MPALIRLLKLGEMRAGRGGARPEAVKEGRYTTNGFGLYPQIANPPYTTLTAYDLNQGTIRWQIGLGDDLRLAGQGIKGTGTAAMTKGGIIVTATGLLFVTAADRKVHVYDSTTGFAKILCSGVFVSGRAPEDVVTGSAYFFMPQAERDQVKWEVDRGARIARASLGTTKREARFVPSRDLVIVPMGHMRGQGPARRATNTALGLVLEAVGPAAH